MIQTKMLLIIKFVPWLILLNGCVSIISGPKDKDPKTLPQYWLTTSLYVGPFYEDDESKLIDFRPFFALDDAKTPDGTIITPTKIDGIIPVGSQVTVTKIAYPTDYIRQNRPQISPQNNIWVYLRIGKERGRTTIFREKPHIMVMPPNITTEEQLNGYLRRFLSSKDPNRWLLQQESYFQNGIFDKKPMVGMKRQHLISALGPAIKKQYKKLGSFEQAEEIWHYHDYLIVIENDIVAKISKLKSEVTRTTQK